MRTCSVEGCGGAHEARGFCRVHYRRVVATGSTEARKGGKPYAGRTAEQVRQHIAANVTVTPGGCWEWQLSCNPESGYSSLRWLGIGGGHRVSYTVHVGPIPDGLWICHHCDNPPCVNPEHLFAGTADDNQADMTGKGRAVRQFTGQQRGERHHLAKLSDADVAAVRASSDRGTDLARRYGVSPQLISDIRHGRKR